jgi:hypothetical protein
MGRENEWLTTETTPGDFIPGLSDSPSPLDSLRAELNDTIENAQYRLDLLEAWGEDTWENGEVFSVTVATVGDPYKEYLVFKMEDRGYRSGRGSEPMSWSNLVQWFLDYDVDPATVNRVAKWELAFGEAEEEAPLPMKVDCPICLARTGERCMRLSGNGHAMRGFHSERKWAERDARS